MDFPLFMNKSLTPSLIVLQLHNTHTVSYKTTTRLPVFPLHFHWLFCKVLCMYTCTHNKWKYILLHHEWSGSTLKIAHIFILYSYSKGMYKMYDITFQCLTATRNVLYPGNLRYSNHDEQ